MERNIKKRNLYAKIEKLGYVGMLGGSVAMGVTLLTSGNPALLLSSSVVAVTGMFTGIIGNDLKFRENMKSATEYFKEIEESNKNTKKLSLKK